MILIVMCVTTYNALSKLWHDRLGAYIIFRSRLYFTADGLMWAIRLIYIMSASKFIKHIDKQMLPCPINNNNNNNT